MNQTNLLLILPVVITSITNVSVYIEQRAHVLEYETGGQTFRVTNVYERVWTVVDPICPPMPPVREAVPQGAPEKGK